MTIKKYCVALIHKGSEKGIFLSGKDDEKLTLEDALKFAGGGYVFDCTADEYYEQDNVNG
jgi:hypothetical protein